MISNPMKIRIIAFLAMAVCSPVVFGMVILMNKFVNAPQKAISEGMVSFDVQNHVQKKKPDVEKVIPKKRKSRPAPRSLAPLPTIGTSLSGIQIDMPEFASAALHSLTEGLFGSGDGLSTSIMTEETVDERPLPLRRAALIYPARARAMNVTGFVTMNLLIGRDGRVRNVQVLESQPAGVFDETAVTSIRDWEFRPATYQQQPVEVWAKQTIRFDFSS